MIDLNISNYLRLSLTDVILTLISTSLIILFARHFFWGRILEFVKKRQQVIQQNIDDSQQLKQEAEKVKEQYDEQMKNAGKDAHAIITNAKAQAEQEKDKILASASAEAAQIKDEAYQDIEREKRKAEGEMKAAISSVAIEAARSLLQKEVDEQTQQEYIDSFIDKAGQSEW